MYPREYKLKILEDKYLKYYMFYVAKYIFGESPVKFQLLSSIFGFAL